MYFFCFSNDDVSLSSISDLEDSNIVFEEKNKKSTIRSTDDKRERSSDSRHKHKKKHKKHGHKHKHRHKSSSKKEKFVK